MVINLRSVPHRQSRPFSLGTSQTSSPITARARRRAGLFGGEVNRPPAEPKLRMPAARSVKGDVADDRCGGLDDG